LFPCWGEDVGEVPVLGGTKNREVPVLGGTSLAFADEMGYVWWSKSSLPGSGNTNNEGEI
jgi:hypothetical protein